MAVLDMRSQVTDEEVMRYVNAMISTSLPKPASPEWDYSQLSDYMRVQFDILTRRMLTERDRIAASGEGEAISSYRIYKAALTIYGLRCPHPSYWRIYASRDSYTCEHCQVEVFTCIDGMVI